MNYLGGAVGDQMHLQQRHCSLPIELRRHASSPPLRSTTTDLSTDGCYVHLSSALRVYAVVEIVLWVGETKLEFRGTVRTADSNVGNGIIFTGMTDEQRTCLQRFLDGIKGTAPPRSSIFR